MTSCWSFVRTVTSINSTVDHSIIWLWYCCHFIIWYTFCISHLPLTPPWSWNQNILEELGQCHSCEMLTFLIIKTSAMNVLDIQKQKGPLSHKERSQMFKNISLCFWKMNSAWQVLTWPDVIISIVFTSILCYQGAVSIRKTVLPGMAIPMLKIRRPNGRLIFNMEITIRR